MMVRYKRENQHGCPILLPRYGKNDIRTLDLQKLMAGKNTAKADIA
jgi:hypothetical protein